MGSDDVIIPIPSGGSIPIPSRSDRADLIDKISPERAVQIIRQQLMGKDFINGNWVEVPALRNRKLSEVGAWELSNLMLGVSTINVSVSKMKEEAIRKRALSIAKTAQRMLLSNWIAYELNNISQQNYVHEIIFTNSIAVLNQSNEASIQDLLKSTIQENRNVQQERKEGVTSRIKRVLGLG